MEEVLVGMAAMNGRRVERLASPVRKVVGFILAIGVWWFGGRGRSCEWYIWWIVSDIE